MNNRGQISIYLVFLLLLVSIIVVDINYKSISLLEITQDYKNNIINFYNSESQIKKLLFDNNEFDDNFDMLIRESLQYKKKNISGNYKDIEYNVSVLSDKKLKINGRLNNIYFDSKISILNDIYNNQSGLIELNMTDLDFEESFDIIKNYNITGMEKYSRINAGKSLDINRILCEDNINLLYISDNITLESKGDSKRYIGVIIVEGDINIVDDFKFSGIIISKGSVLLKEGACLNINGAIICNDIYGNSNIVTNYEYTNKLIYGKYIRNYIDKSIENLKVY